MAFSHSPPGVCVLVLVKTCFKNFSFHSSPGKEKKNRGAILLVVLVVVNVNVVFRVHTHFGNQ